MIDVASFILQTVGMTHAKPLNPATIVFDLDGTLADTAGDIIATLNAVLGKLDLAPLPLDSAREMIGAGARVLLQRGLKASGVSVTPERLEDLFQDFLAHYEIHLADESTLFPGVELALSALKGEGHRLAVCTNKIEAHSILLLEALKIDGHFSAICGRDSFEYFKPDARHLTLTIEKSGGSSTRAVMVGDSKTDIDTARNASIPVVGVSFGYTDIPIVDLKPDRLIHHYDDLQAAVASLLAPAT
jgi:phosphoglycolate phosphatase